SLIAGPGVFDGQNTLRLSENYSGWQIVVIRSNDILINTLHPALASSATAQQLKLNLLGSRTNALNSQFFKGFLSEFMVFNRRITEEEALALTHYLRYKFFPPLSLGNDTSLVCGSCNYPIVAPSGYLEYQWSNGSTLPQTVAQQTGTYTLTVTDAFNLMSSDDIRVVCPSQSCYPSVNLGPDLYGTCGFCNFTISASAPHFVNYLWSTGATTPTIVVTSTGYYSVTATDIDGYLSVDTIFVQCPTVSCDPPVNLGSDISVTYGFCPVTIQANTIYNQYLWSTGSTQSSITVNNPGTYWVRVVDQYNFISSDTIKVLYPTIQLRDTAFCSGQSVILNPNLGNGYTYLWSTTSMNPTIQVNQPGDFWVMVFDSLGCSRKSQTIRVSEDTLPLMQWFSSYDTTLCRNSQLSVINIPNYSYSWNTSETGNSITVENGGLYRLTVTSPYGCTSTDSVFVHINGQAPIVIFGVNDGCTNTPLTVINETVSIDQVPITRWEWRINQQLVDTVQYPILTINQPGTHEITLTAGNQNGCVATQSKTVTVYPTPNIQLIAPEIACTQMPVHFSADVSPASSSISYLWTVQGQFFSNEPSPFLIFDSAGFFTVSLTVTTPEACYSTAEKTIQVIDINPESQTITLTSPQANEIINSGRVMFHWQAIGSFLNFTLQISNDPSFNSILFEAETTQTSLSVTLPPYHILYWRVVGTNLCHSLVYSTSQALQKFSPQSLNSLALWLSADSVLISHGKVVQWYDLSPNHFLIQQPTATNQPQKVENGLNGRPVIRFNGTNTYLDGGDILDLGTNSHTVFLIGSRNSANGVFFAKSLSGAVSGRYALLHETNNFYFLYQDNISREIYTNQFQIGRFYLIQAINNRDDAKNQLLLNSELIGEKNINEFYEFNTDYRFLIGAYNNSTGGLPPNSNLYLNGDIAEIIIYNRLLTEQESDQIKQYLALKYGLAVNLGDDIFAQSFCPVTLEIPGDFTNVLWSTGSTEHTTTVSESGVYWVEATNTFGIITRDTIEVRFPTIDIPDEVYFCLGSSTTVEPHLEGNYTYLWSNGMTTPSIQISTPGNYWVRVTDSLGCWKEHYFRAKADSFALQASLGDDGPICNGTRVSLVSGSENAVAYLWSNGSNLPYFTINNHTQVSVTVTNNNGCQAIDTINLSIIGDAPLLAFDHGALCKANQFAFTDHSQSLDGSAIATRRWIFNHTDTLYGSQVSYSYPDTGKIQIQLKVSTESGCWNDTSFNRRVNDIPMVNFSPTTVCERNSVQFTSFGTLSDGTITGYHWDFPESTLTTANPVYSFSTAGQQTVSLTLTSNHGCSNSITKTVEIKNSPVADFTWSTACEGLPVRFTNTTQTWLSTLSDYFWTFNQQVNFTQTHPQYTFPTAGNYVVQLVAIQRVNQCRDTILKTVTVAPNPTALPFPASGCATETIALHHASIPGIGYSLNQVEWNVAPVAGIISGNHLISNNTAGTFPIEITVTNNAGCSASAQSTVQIFEKPDAHIVIPNDTLYLPVNFIVSSLNNNAEYLYRWYRNGTLTSTDSSWRFIQNMAQIDTLALEMRTPHGCFDSDRMVITTLVPEIDLEMISMSATIFNNQLLIRVQIRNNGTVPINNTLLKITSDKFNSISELCTETVSPGQILPYTLRTRILINENELPRYICVETETNGDNLIENNSQCFFFDTQLRIFNPTPNPARDFVDVKIISPSSAWAEFTFINSMGAILDQKSHAIEEGLNNIRLSLPKSATGVIVLKIKIVDNSHFYKILVNQ
ncbi:MAG TPA: PKD domain-containing protein, partial [Salinivirgaceae bacterium]|nr:PKD domain-containing protein [Salinivirgaceae bacterium]